MYVSLSKKEMSCLLCLLEMANSSTDYWTSMEDMPLILQEQSVNTGKQASKVCDNLQQNLKIWIEQ